MNSIQRLAAEVGAALSPLSGLVASRKDARGLLKLLGWEMPPGVDDIGLTGLDASRVSAKLAELKLSGQTDDGAASIDVGAFGDLLKAVQDLEGDIHTLALGLSGLPANYVAKTNIGRLLVPRLLDFLIIRYLLVHHELLAGTLSLLGIFQHEAFAEDPGIFQSKHFRHTVRFDRLSVLLSSPRQLFVESFGWGTPNTSGDVLVAVLGVLLNLLGVAAPTYRTLPRRVEERLSGKAVPSAVTDPRLQIIVPLIKDSDRSPVQLGIALHALRPTTPSGSDGGFAIAPLVKGFPKGKAGFDLPGGMKFSIASSVDLGNGAVLNVRAGQPPTLQSQILLGGTIAETQSGQLEFRLETASLEQSPPRLLAIPGGSRIEVPQAAIVCGIRSGGQTSELFVELELREARFILELAESGELLKALLPKDAVQAVFDLGIGWAEGRAYLRGSQRLQVDFPVHTALGPVEVDSIHLGVAPGGTAPLSVELSGALTTTIGPLEFRLERIGLDVLLDFPHAGGNLGPLDFGVAFKLPSAIGLSLDAGPISGGGYLALDPTGQRYAGVLQLKLPMCSVVAFGIYEQVQGRASFVAVLGIRFTPGIQLSFGFTLNGVGGLVGLNRRADVDVLRERLASGAAGNVLFCEDPLHNAPSLLSDLAAFFPPVPSGFLVGPTLQIGWMSPLVRLDLGILIELPGPSKIVILGSARLMIGADETLALLYVRMDVLGSIDFPNKLIAFDAQLVNSHALGIFRLSGGMAFRLAYGSGAYILLSVGGFHPRFDPGPLKIPALPRVGASFDISVIVEVYLRLEMYVAFTSNTLQIGALVEAGMQLGPLQADGHFQFDALIQFQPFLFEADFSAGFNVRAFGLSLASVDLDGRVSGPGPIVVHASGSIRRFGIKVKGSATFEIGDRNADRQDVIASLVQALAPELSRGDNLRAEGEDSTALPKPDRGAVAGVLVLPRGVLIWEQKRVPLKTIVDRFEGGALDGVHELLLEGPPGWTAVDESDWFSPGRFATLDTKASQTLNNATFQELPSGLRIGLAVDARAADVRSFAVDLHLIKRPSAEKIGIFARAYMNGALAAATCERSVTPAVDGGAPKVSVQPETFDVRGPAGATLHSGQTPFQAFQLSREGPKRVALPSSDEVLSL